MCSSSRPPSASRSRGRPAMRKARFAPAVVPALLMALLGAPAVWTQAAPPMAGESPAPAGAPQVGAPAPSGTAAPSGPAAPARSFRSVELGMDRDSVIAALEKDPIFDYRGPEDLSLLPSPNQSLIEVAGLSFVRRGYF